ncbi:MAG TPA: DHA2 family efflux MFS transporter permease subunit [Acidimicrobiales bacterium]
MGRAKLRDGDWVYRHRWMTLSILCVSLLIIILDNTILNIALPTLAKEPAKGGLGASPSQLQWIVDAYTIVFAGLLLSAGSLGDRFGRYRCLVIGLAVFGTGSLLSAFTKSADVLILTRACMGAGGAFIMPSTLSILTNVFTDPRERTKAIGLWAGVAGLAGLGPIVGGVLLTHFWWGSVFLVNVPIVIFGLIGGYFLIPDSRDPSGSKLDPGGALLSIAALGTLLWAIIEGPAHGWQSTSILLAFGIGTILLIAFLAWELSSSNPMLDMRFFKDPRFSAASGAITLTFLALFGMLFLLTQYFQIVLGYSTVKAGLVLLPQAAIMLVLAPFSSVLVARFGNKLVVAGGLLIVAVCLLLLTTLDAHSSTPHVVIVVALLAVGMGNVMAPATDSIMGSLPRAKAGVGSAVNDTTRQMGGAVGVALLGSLVASQFSSRMFHLLRGVVPASVLAQVTTGISQAVGEAAQDPAARPFATQIANAAKTSFVSGFHLAAVVAAVIILVAATAVMVWLPARATREEEAPVPAPAVVA